MRWISILLVFSGDYSFLSAESNALSQTAIGTQKGDPNNPRAELFPAIFRLLARRAPRTLRRFPPNLRAPSSSPALKKIPMMMRQC